MKVCWSYEGEDGEGKKEAEAPRVLEQLEKGGGKLVKARTTVRLLIFLLWSCFDWKTGGRVLSCISNDNKATAIEPPSFMHGARKGNCQPALSLTAVAQTTCDRLLSNLFSTDRQVQSSLDLVTIWRIMLNITTIDPIPRFAVRSCSTTASLRYCMPERITLKRLVKLHVAR